MDVDGVDHGEEGDHHYHYRQTFHCFFILVLMAVDSRGTVLGDYRVELGLVGFCTYIGLV